jgi:hypothetical protein
MTDETTQPEEESRHIRPFAAWLAEQRAGALATELAEALNEVVDAVCLYGKAGELTLKLSVSPAARGGNTIVTVSDTVTAKPPRAPRPEVIFFVDGDRNLTRANPAQAPLPLREVPVGPQAVNPNRDEQGGTSA